MTNQEYLQNLLKEQNLTDNQEETLKGLRERVQNRLANLRGGPRFYYAGSFGKKTMIREHYDLDVVAYWPHDYDYTLKDIFNDVGSELKKEWKTAHPKTVSWEIRFEGGFHIDVVPGRALDATFKYANLYRRDTDSHLQTSIKVHIDTILNSGRRDAVRLMKLWRARKNITFKTFLLELMTINGCKGTSLTELAPQLSAAFRHIHDSILTARVLDPANSNNEISNEVTETDKRKIKDAAKAALEAKSWPDVF